MISVGDELLAGRMTDTNASWLSSTLRGAGFPVVRRETVGDDAEQIAVALRAAAAEADVVVLTGGLGPTPDDLTRHGVARAMEVDCVRSDEAVSQIQELFERSGRKATAANMVQADIPCGCRPLHNRWGTAPGIHGALKGAQVFVLPGVPREMKHMTEACVLPVLAEHPEKEGALVRRSLTVVGVSESVAGERIAQLMRRGRDPSVGSYPGVAHLVLVVESRDAEAVEEDVRAIKAAFGDAVICDQGAPLHEVVARALMAQDVTLAVAESLTGGRISDLLISVPGVSAVFQAGLVTYSDASKQALLGVRGETLAEHGAVSEVCAREMAEGVRGRAGAQVGLATTGIAGPTGAVPGKPIGTVFVALSSDSGTEVRRLSLLGDRTQIRERAAVAALDMLRRHLRP